MKKQRKHYTPEEKVTILRRHLLEQVPISELCDKQGLQPTVFYPWQKEFFENGAAAFQPKARPNHSAEQCPQVFVLSDVTCPSVRRARPLLRVRPGLRPGRQLRVVPAFQMQGASSKTCEPFSGSSQSTNKCPPHSPTRTTKNSILKLAGAFH